MSEYNYGPRHKANEASRTTAEAHGEIWEQHEEELLQEGWADDESTLAEIAELLGRTIEACRQRHYEILRRPARVRRDKQAKSANNSAWDKGWTSVEDMGY